jgi:hypothetical protein
MKNIIIVFFLALYSCNSITDKGITIHPSIREYDSILILNIKNNTDSNLMVEFPELENFFYKDELASSNSEVIYTQKSFNSLIDSVDLFNYKTLNCKSIQSLMQIEITSIPKFLKKKSEKKYYLKIKRYRKGKTIVFKDDGFDIFLDKASKENILKLKNQNCGGYKYFTGHFKFYPDNIVLQ